jgi:hypothetical protein
VSSRHRTAAPIDLGGVSTLEKRAGDMMQATNRDRKPGFLVAGYRSPLA